MLSCCCPSADLKARSRYDRSWRTLPVAGMCHRNVSTMWRSTTCTSAGCRRSTGSTGIWSPSCKLCWTSRSISATVTGSLTLRTPLQPCATTGSGARRCSLPRRGVDIPAAPSIPRTLTGPGGRPGLVRPSWSNCGDTSIIRCSSRYSPTTSRPPRAQCRRMHGWCSPRTRYRWQPTTGSAPSCTAAKCVMPQGLSRRLRVTPTTTWPGSRARGHRRCRGWNRTSPTTLRRSPRRAPRRSSSARSVSSPTTSRWCGISTPSCANRPTRRA